MQTFCKREREEMIRKFNDKKLSKAKKRSKINDCQRLMIFRTIMQGHMEIMCTYKTGTKGLIPPSPPFSTNT